VELLRLLLPKLSENGVKMDVEWQDFVVWCCVERLNGFVSLPRDVFGNVNIWDIWRLHF
jgi:hypothetical protein